MHKSDKTKGIKNAAESECIEKTEQSLSSEENLISPERADDNLLEIIEKMKNEIKNLTEDAARARADYYNLRTRVERDREKNCKLAAERTIEELLPVFENMERVCCAVEDEKSNLYKGMSMITKQFYKALENLGLENIETEGPFDPAVHEAVSIEPVDDRSKDGCIIGTLRKGYRLAGRVIRAPHVRVGKYTE